MESSLTSWLIEIINTEIVTGTVETISEIVDWLSWTFFYRWLPLNPNYYNLASKEKDAINDFIS